MVTIEATQWSSKPQKIFSYACCIYGLNEHKMTNCPKFNETQKMFHGKFVTITEVQPIVTTQTINTNVKVVDFNVTTRSKTIEERVFRDR
jgi:hypothetical protein